MQKENEKKQQINDLTTQSTFISFTPQIQQCYNTNNFILPSAPSSPLSSPNNIKKTPYPLRATRSLLKFGLLKKHNSAYGNFNNFNTPITDDTKNLINENKLNKNNEMFSPLLPKENLTKRQTIRNYKKRNKKRANSINNVYELEDSNSRPMLASSMAAAASKYLYILKLIFKNC